MMSEDFITLATVLSNISLVHQYNTQHHTQPNNTEVVTNLTLVFEGLNVNDNFIHYDLDEFLFKLKLKNLTMLFNCYNFHR